MPQRKAQPKPTVRYRIGWDNPNEHLFDIEIAFRARGRETELFLPAWRPGRYLIQNYAANIREWSARARGAGAVQMVKRDKSTWVVTAKSGQDVVVRYRFFAGILDAGSSFLDETEAYFNGTNLFMMVADRRKQPVSLEIAAPPKWKIETQLKPAGANRFIARDWDYLVDSPTIASPTLVRHTFRESGCNVSLVFQGAEGLDTKAFVAPTRAIVRAQAAMFGEIPTGEYRFLYHVFDKWHGVEHEDSCSIVVKRSELLGSKPGDPAWDHFLAIASHEFFHVWNVKRILPKAFAPYDFSTEAYTKQLWVMEGVTSYYGEKMLLRSGLWSPERYLEHMGNEIGTLESTPGRMYLSLAQASFDGWLQDPAQMHDRSNAWVSFYLKGEIVAALLDIAIRRATRGKRSIDDVMRDLWTKYGRRGRGMEEDAIEKSASAIARKDLSDFFRKYLDGLAPLPYKEMFGALGIAFESKPATAERVFGAKLKRSEGRIVVDSVISGSAAALAGLLPNDEVIAIDGTRIAADGDIDRIMRSAPEQKSFELIVGRADRIAVKDVTPAEDSRVTVKLSLSPKADGEAVMLRSSWLAENA